MKKLGILIIGLLVGLQLVHAERYGSHGEYQLPENTCVSDKFPVKCRHVNYRTPFEPYHITDVATSCTFSYELFYFDSKRYKVHSKTETNQRHSIVNDNGFLSVLNTVLINSVNYLTVEGMKSENKIIINKRFEKIERAIEKNICD